MSWSQRQKGHSHRVRGGVGSILTIQVSLPTLGDSPAALVLVLLQHPDLLKRLHDLAIHRAAGVHVVTGLRATVLGRAVDLAQPADTHRLAEVDVSCDGRGTGVEPVG